MADEQLPEERESLWMLTVGPAIWSLHLVLSYGTAAVYCAKFTEGEGSLGPVRWAIAAYTLVALIGIIMSGVRGWRQHSYGSATVPHDFDTPADRHRFLGFATLLLSALSAVATLYVAMPALFIGSCR